MSVDLQETIQDQVRVLSDDELKQVLKFMRNLRKEKSEQQARPISAIFEDLSSEIPLEEWEELPSDGAENHDHYLYGASKKD